MINRNYSLSILRTILLNNLYLEIFSKLETGKTPSQKRVSPFDFMQVRIPELSKEKQDLLQEKIVDQESKISKFKSQIGKERKSMDDMINTLI